MSTATARSLAEIEALIRSRHALLYLLTPEEARWERLLGKLAERLGLPLIRWSRTQGATPPLGDTATDDPRALLEAIGKHEGKALFLLQDFHAFLGDAWVARRLRELDELLSRQGSTVLLSSPVLDLPPELERDVTVLDLPRPDASDLRPIVSRALAQLADRAGQAAGAELSAGSAEAVERGLLGLTERDAVRVLRRVLSQGRVQEDDLVRAIVAEKRRALRRSDLLEYRDTNESLGALGGLGQLKQWLARRQGAFSNAARERGLPTPRGVLLLGVQGCGKSLAAKAVAYEWGFPLVRLDLAAVVRAERGDGETLASALAVVEQLAPVVLWVDELEKGFADATGGGEGAVARALGTFVTWLQEKRAPVFVVATANRVDVLPAELLRKGRFDELFFVDLPSLEERREIVRIHLAKRELDPAAFDVENLAHETGTLSGAEIEEAVLSACYEAFADKRDVTDADILDAVHASVPLAITMESEIEALRDWARQRARPASLDTRLEDMIEATLVDR